MKRFIKKLHAGKVSTEEMLEDVISIISAYEFDPVNFKTVISYLDGFSGNYDGGHIEYSKRIEDFKMYFVLSYTATKDLSFLTDSKIGESSKFVQYSEFVLEYDFEKRKVVFLTNNLRETNEEKNLLYAVAESFMTFLKKLWEEIH